MTLLRGASSFPWINILDAEWTGVVCAICGDEKWAQFPFCRHCSIRLQRIGLMSRLKPYAGHSFSVVVRRKMVTYYDLCRDYLIVSAREREMARCVNTETSEQL